MALLVTIELCTLWFAVGTLSSVRSFVNGEALWSKAQKDAVYNLFAYSHSHDEKHFHAFREFLKVPLGDNKTRLELQKTHPDFDVARKGFIEGRNHPDNVDGMISLIVRFHDISYLQKAIVAWGDAEMKMEQLIALGDKLHNMIRSGKVSQQEIDKLMVQAEELNKKVTISEDEFSYTLDEGARWLENIVLRVLLTLSLTIGTTSILITISVSRGIEKGVNAIINAAKLIGRGLLHTRVEVYSGDEIGMLATSFNQMTDTLEHSLHDINELKDKEDRLKIEKEKAETSEKTKQLFLAKMSHEIRTPMNAILGFAKLLEETIKGDEEQEYIHIIIKSGDDLLVILNDILDFSRLEAGKIVFESIPIRIRDIIYLNVKMMQTRKKDIEITYSIDEAIPEIVLGDSVRLNQIMINLISNAIKFTEKGGIYISVICAEGDADSVLLDFSVKDTGIGIPKEKQAKIFESFEQATNDTARKYGGAGLGLSIVKQLIELQNGLIFVNSEPGIGSEFHFRLQFLKFKAEIQTSVPVKTSTINQSGRGIKILVVEDNLINQKLVIKVLKNQGFETEVAENGLIALNKYEHQDFDIILMDIQMPEMDGYEATRKIRELSSYKKNIPIIAMTAHIIKGELDHCLETGMNDFVSKPFDKNELYAKIFKHLEVRTQ
ncbi:response regulator [Mucilaginibacter sp. ZT4R22]|uniref:histidine kinase n=1 Tax=Mucilaginibacter pankratovii TaxID=2772110 RepID=A0ABR7WS37_9SPHI|nr:response regulator [Mucilaginibacter pankratovii]MBD1365115.1 response regulator [Mucilaginibacter pankratovii]